MDGNAVVIQHALHNRCRHAGPRSGLAALLVLSGWFVGLCAAQPVWTEAPIDSQPASTPAISGQGDASANWRTRIAVAADGLWLAAFNEQETRLLRREPGTPFRPEHAIPRTIEAIWPNTDHLLVVFPDGSLSSYYNQHAAGDFSPQSSVLELRLPGDAKPIDAFSRGSRLYAIIPTAAARELPVARLDGTADDQAALAFNDAPLSVAVYDGRAWRAISALPANVQAPADARLRPRLMWIREHLFVLAPGPVSNAILVFRYDEQRGTWRGGDTIGRSNIRGFWAATLSGLPAILLATGSDDGEQISALRFLGNPEDARAIDWKSAELQLSELPGGTSRVTYRDAVAFNQQIVLLVRDDQELEYLQYGRVGEAPTEPTAAVAEIIRRPELANRSQVVLTMVTFFLLMSVLIGLFVFRRNSFVNAVELPPQWLLCSSTRRLLAFLIDFAPFALVAAYRLGLSSTAAIGELYRWGMSPSQEEPLPDLKSLTWWGLAVGGFFVYSLTMELITRRTIGKTLLGIRLLSETGERPTAAQILLRNVLRLIELIPMPQFLVFVILVPFSRNRQRLGDIFARTIAVCRISPAMMQLLRDVRQAKDTQAEKQRAGAEDEGRDDAADENDHAAEDQHAEEDHADQPAERPPADEDDGERSDRT